MLQPGTQAPDFVLKDQQNNDFRLSEMIGKKKIVLYFYPKDETMGCVAEACSFRDQYEDFVEAGAEVVGVSGDSVQSHQDFIQNRRLPFILLSDPGRKIHQLYEVGSALFGLSAERITYVIDLRGEIRYAFHSQFRFQKHVEDALEMVKQG